MPKKQQEKTTPKLGNVFGDDNSDEDDSTDWVKKALEAEGEKNKMKKQTKLDIQKALNEDPTIYQYDEVYDDMERTKSQANLNKQKEKKPRYIQNLLKTADQRKKEQEHRKERMVQKEREAEGDMYADKESFVTSAYRAKLEEFKKMEEEEIRMNRLEAIGDVTKQQDMSGFYRHLYEQTVDYKSETNEDESNKTTGEEMEKKNLTSSTNREEETATVNKINTIDEGQKVITKLKKSRQYRQRAIEIYESDSETETNKEDLKKKRALTPPAHEDIDKLEMPQESDRKKQKQDKNDINKVENVTDTKDKNSNIKDKVEVSENHKEAIASESEKIESKEKPVEKDRSSIWQKRTVGPIFEAALQRYYTRKAKRLAAAS